MDTLSKRVISLGLLYMAIIQVDTAASKTNWKAPFKHIQPDEYRLIRDLLRPLKPHQPHLRPLRNSSKAIMVGFSVALIQLLDFDEKSQIINLMVWKRYKWRDEFMTWIPSQYGGLMTIRLPSRKVWTPDIVLYSNLDSTTMERHSALLLIDHDGTVNWLPPVVYRSSCQVDITNFPFDQQTCVFKFGAWSHSTREMDVDFWDGKPEMDISGYLASEEWSIVNNTAVRNNVTYPCCADAYSDLTFTLVLRRNPGFYTRLLLLPAILLSSLVLVIFWIPPQRPDRTSLGMSLFSSFLLLLLVVIETAPPSTSTLLGSYCCVSMLLVTCATVLSAVTVNLAAQKRPLPNALNNTVVLNIVARVLCLHPSLSHGSPPPVQHKTDSIDHNQPSITSTDNHLKHKTLFSTLDHPGGSKPRSVLQNGEDSAVARAPPPASHQQPCYDWTFVATIFDRVFFVIYFVAFVVILCILFPNPAR